MSRSTAFSVSDHTLGLQREPRLIYAAISPVLVVEAVFIVVLLLGAESSQIDAGLNGRELAGLVGAAIVFPVAAEPFVFALATRLERSQSRRERRHLKASSVSAAERIASAIARASPDAELSVAEVDRRLRRNLGFSMMVLELPLWRALPNEASSILLRIRKAISATAVRAIAYYLGSIVVFVLYLVTSGRGGRERIVALVVAVAIAMLLSSVTYLRMQSLRSAYWVTFADFAVTHRFKLLSSLNLPLPSSIEEERERWRQAAFLLGRGSDQAHGIRFVYPTENQDVQFAANSLMEAFGEPPPIAYDGFIVAQVATGENRSTRVRLTLASSATGDHSERVKVDGRTAPYVDFRLELKIRGALVRSDDLMLRADQSGEPSSLDVELGVISNDELLSSHATVRVYQYKRPIQSLQFPLAPTAEHDAEVPLA